jgi:hypothetical protein
LATNTGDNVQLFFRQIGASFYHPGFTQIFTRFGIVRVQGKRALIIPNPFIRAAQFAGGVPR